MFLVNVVQHWQSLLTGGLIAMAVFIYEHKKGKSVPWRVLVGIMGLCLFISCYLAWHDEHQNSEALKRDKAKLTSDKGALEARVDEKQNQINQLLSQLGGGSRKASPATPQVPGEPTSHPEPYSEAQVSFKVEQTSDSKHILVKIWVDRPVHRPIYYVQFDKPVKGEFGGSSFGMTGGGVLEGVKLPPSILAYKVAYPDPVTSDMYVVFTASAESEPHVLRVGLMKIVH